MGFECVSDHHDHVVDHPSHLPDSILRTKETIQDSDIRISRTLSEDVILKLHDVEGDRASECVTPDRDTPFGVLYIFRYGYVQMFGQ